MWRKSHWRRRWRAIPHCSPAVKWRSSWRHDRGISLRRRRAEARSCRCWKGAAQAVHHAVATEDDHRVEQGRRNGLAYDGNAGGVDQQAGFYAFGFGERTESVAAGIVIPAAWGDGGQLFRQLGKQLRNFRILPELGLGGRVELEIIREKCA